MSTRESELFETVANFAIFLSVVSKGYMKVMMDPQSEFGRIARMAIALKKPVVLLFDLRVGPEERQQVRSFYATSKVLLEMDVDTRDPEKSWEELRIKLSATLERLAKELIQGNKIQS